MGATESHRMDDGADQARNSTAGISSAGTGLWRQRELSHLGEDRRKRASLVDDQARMVNGATSTKGNFMTYDEFGSGRAFRDISAHPSQHLITNRLLYTLYYHLLTLQSVTLTF